MCANANAAAATLPCPAGYTSVSHYLVLNNLDDAGKAEALKRGMCPPELAGEGWSKGGKRWDGGRHSCCCCCITMM